MKKVEVYLDPERCSVVGEILGEIKVYWYRDYVEMQGSKTLCRVVFYAPIHALPQILGKIAEALDLRRKENIIIVQDVEAGLGRPYTLTGKRFLPSPTLLLAKPIQTLREEAEDKAHYTLGQVVLIMIASIIALAGLLHDDPYLIIGAMLLSPILGPIYSFSASMVLGSRRVAASSLVTVTILLAAALSSAVVASTILRAAGYGLEPTREILLRARASPSDLLVAILLGVASIVAVSSNVTEALTGVAIAAAIIPPTSALGWTIVYNSSLAVGVLVTILLNVSGLLVGGVLSILALARSGRLARFARVLAGALENSTLPRQQQ